MNVNRTPETLERTMVTKWLWQASLVALASLSIAACTLDNPDPGQFSGPSELGTSVEMRALPDQLVADGFSSSVIEAVVRGPDGQRDSGREVIFDLTSPGVGQFFDLGNLAPLNGPRPTYGGVESGPVSSVSDGDGVARARYWAPFRTDQENDTVVQITGRPSGTDFNGATFRSARIFLRAANRPSFPGSNECGFIIEPVKASYKIGEPIAFTASQITASDACGGNEIARYEWNIAPNTFKAGRDIVHAFPAAGSFSVFLTTTAAVTGCQESCSASITVVP